MSCSAKRIEIPAYSNVNIKNEWAKMENTSLTSLFSIEFDRGNGILKGEASLQLTPDTLELRVYSLGFLVAEVSADKTTAKSSPSMDRNRLAVLVDGLRSSFSWWSIKNPDIRDDYDKYAVSNSWRWLSVSKETLMPIEQMVELEDGRQLKISYTDPALIDGVRFPSKIHIEFSSYSINLQIKTISLTTASFN